jgi:nitroreductase
MDVIEAIYHRRVVRAYTGEPVDQETVKSLVDAAIQAPSAVNQQPWSFAIVGDKNLLDRISRASKTQMLANLPAVAASDHFRELLSDPDFQIFYHAPTLIVISAITASPWAVEDCSLVLARLVQATASGSATIARHGSATPGVYQTARS